jgi:hypothetical protein
MNKKFQIPLAEEENFSRKIIVKAICELSPEFRSFESHLEVVIPNDGSVHNKVSSSILRIHCSVITWSKSGLMKVSSLQNLKKRTPLKV